MEQIGKYNSAAIWLFRLRFLPLWPPFPHLYTEEIALSDVLVPVCFEWLPSVYNNAQGPLPRLSDPCLLFPSTLGPRFWYLPPCF